jgi:hypothetical protein
VTTDEHVSIEVVDYAGVGLEKGEMIGVINVDEKEKNGKRRAWIGLGKGEDKKILGSHKGARFLQR